MKRAADGAEAAAVDHCFSLPTENFLFQSAYGHQEID